MQSTILLVEDDEPLRYAVEVHLKEAGFAVVAVAGGMAALQILDDQPVHLLLADVRLPSGGPHGLSLANMTKRRFGIPVIFMTAYRELLDASEYLPGEVFYKPVDLAELTAGVARRLPEQASEPQESPERIRRWRMKAEEIRSAADGFADGSARQHMRNSADTYEALANAAEARLQRGKEAESDAG